MSEQSEKSAADLLEQVGRTLFDDADDWQSQLAAILDVRRDTVRKWLHGTIPLNPRHGMLDRLLGIVSRRAAELAGAEAEMRAWLDRNRTAAPGV